METIFRKLDLEPLVFGTFGEMIDGVKEVLEISVEYGAKHLGRCMAASTVDAVRATIRREYKSQLSMASRRRYANLRLDRTKYVGTHVPCMSRDQIRLPMGEREDIGEYTGMYMAHETYAPLRDVC